ncbi:hypothetical protein ASPTUDRAFT_938988 [Aspergillus tubingensis CBS 134.48]|uniref:Uncharacterized protein n=1 Tax=Aspergillus tubingensis (strain CBS 134.48) TaxID=767770 RepID=A0A1L9MRN7_ASPTC|nr:hypothetical protein ASPTUDRAFT_938988 [Aspergillus tubingensis CBS 134.48]
MTVHYPMGSAEYPWCWLGGALCTTYGLAWWENPSGTRNSMFTKPAADKEGQKKQRDPGKGRSRSVTSPRLAGRARRTTCLPVRAKSDETSTDWHDHDGIDSRMLIPNDAAQPERWGHGADGPVEHGLVNQTSPKKTIVEGGGRAKKKEKKRKKKQKGTGSTVDQPRRTCFPKPIGPGRSEIKSRMLHTAPASILRCQLRDGKGGKKGRTFLGGGGGSGPRRLTEHYYRATGDR